MLKAFSAGRDLHTESANRAWGGRDNPRAIDTALESLEISNRRKAGRWLASFDYDIVAAEQSLEKQNWRQRSKTILFTRMMGGGPDRVAENLRCSRAEADGFLEVFDAAFPGIRKFLQASKWNAIGHEGAVFTRYDRRLNLLFDEYWKAGPFIV